MKGGCSFSGVLGFGFFFFFFFFSYLVFPFPPQRTQNQPINAKNMFNGRLMDTNDVKCLIGFSTSNWQMVDQIATLIRLFNIVIQVGFGCRYWRCCVGVG